MASRAWVWLIASCAIACSDGESMSTPPSPPSTPPPSTPPPSTPDAAPLLEAPLPPVQGPEAPPRSQSGNDKRADWSDVVTGPACFYFSGPDGRDTKLGADIAMTITGDRVTITWSGVVFEGTLKDNIVDTKRVGRYTFGGPWTTTERLRGPLREGVLDGRYTYEECEVGSACPGTCKIAARVTVR